jgi:hypothetical protein
VSVRHDPQQSTTMLCFSRASSVPRPGATPRSRAFRLAELGRGSIVGAEEYATKLRRVGVFEAVGECVLYRVAFRDVDNAPVDARAAV